MYSHQLTKHESLFRFFFFAKPRHHLKPYMGLIYLLKANIAENDEEKDLGYNSHDKEGVGV